jgi:thymidine kinase
MSQNKMKKGSLEVICGPMFSGKSEELIRRLRRAEIAKQNVAVFKHAIDDRYNIENVTSHNGTKLPAHATDNGSHLLAKVQSENYTVVGIDEVQFYTHDIISTICTLVENGARVIIAGLDMDYRGVPFGPMPTLLAIADSVAKLKAICTECGADAHFSQLLENNKPTSTNSGPLIVAAASDKFTARCRECHHIEKQSDSTQSNQSQT